MENVIALWNGLTPQRRIVAGLASVAVALALFGLFRLASAPSLSLLYSGLDSPAAGEVVQALDQQGAIYEVRGGAIYVESTRRDSLRMTLATEGIPANGPAGYELLDSLSGFGTTSQMFDAAYWRAKEGELARTIMASPLIRSARVHISNSTSRPFARSASQSASVTVIPAGSGIPQTQAQALKFLVASAVAGLASEDVTVIDGRVGRVIGIEDPAASDTGDLRAAELRRRAERLLEAHVGLGNAIVEVSVETVTDREQIVERRLDPDSRVMISTDTEERATTSTDSRGGAVTVASNLPDGDAGAQGQNSSSDNTETRERVNYEVSETTRELVRAPGRIERISVAVLVSAQDPATDSARTPEDLDALRDLVASAVGLNESRGDTIVIEAMPFSLPQDGEATAAAGSLLDRIAIDLLDALQVAALVLVALVLGLFVVRPVLLRPAPPRAPRLEAPPADLRPAQALPSLAAQPARLPGSTAPSLPALTDTSGTAQRLAASMEDRPSDAVAVLRSWMEPNEAKA